MHPNVRNPDGCNGILVRPVGRGCSNPTLHEASEEKFVDACTWLAKIFGEEAGKISNEFLAESADMQDFVLLGKIRKIAEQVCWDK